MSTIIQLKAATATATSLTVTLDAAPATGSILVLIANSTQGIATPFPWVSRASFAGDQGFYVWDKISNGSDGAVTLLPTLSASIAVTMLELSAADVTGFDVASGVNGASGAPNVPISGVTSTGIYGALLLAAGAVHGWSAAPAGTPTYSSGFAATSAALPAGTGATLVGHYLGTKTTGSAGATGGTNVGTTATIDNTAGFLLAYSRTPPLVVVPISAVNAATGWTLTGAASNLAALTDSVDTSYLSSSDTPVNQLLDVQLGSLARPPSAFTVRVRAKRIASSAGIVGKLYSGTTLLSTAPTVTPPSAGYADLLITFPATDLTGVTAGSWSAGLRLTLAASAT